MLALNQSVRGFTRARSRLASVFSRSLVSLVMFSGAASVNAAWIQSPQVNGNVIQVEAGVSNPSSAMAYTGSGSSMSTVSVYRTIDANTWTTSNIQPSLGFIKDIAVDPTNDQYAYVTGTSSTGQPVTYMTQNGGTSWTPVTINNPLGTGQVSVDGMGVSNTGRVYVFDENVGLFYSDRNSTTWSNASKIGIQSLAVNPVQGNTLYLYMGSNRTFERSTDGGVTSTPLSLSFQSQGSAAFNLAGGNVSLQDYAVDPSTQDLFVSLYSQYNATQTGLYKCPTSSLGLSTNITCTQVSTRHVVKFDMLSGGQSQIFAINYWGNAFVVEYSNNGGATFQQVDASPIGQTGGQTQLSLNDISVNSCYVYVATSSGIYRNSSTPGFGTTTGNCQNPGTGNPGTVPFGQIDIEVISVTPTVSTVSAGQSISYTVSLRNNSTATTATGVNVFLTPSTGMTYTTGTSGCFASGTTVQCSRTSIAPLGQDIITLSFTAPTTTGSTVSLAVTSINAGQTDSNTFNNTKTSNFLQVGTGTGSGTGGAPTLAFTTQTNLTLNIGLQTTLTGVITLSDPANQAVTIQSAITSLSSLGSTFTFNPTGTNAYSYTYRAPTSGARSGQTDTINLTLRNANGVTGVGTLRVTFSGNASTASTRNNSSGGALHPLVMFAGLGIMMLMRRRYS